MIDPAWVAVLLETVAAGSLSQAARRLGLTPMVASRRLAALEQELGVRLIHRTTRSLSLTTAGQAFLPHAQVILQAEADARAAVAAEKSGLTGRLRITVSAPFARRLITPLLPTFLQAHPGLSLELRTTEQLVDLAAEGIDLAIRLAPLRDSGLVARRLGVAQRRLFAAPSYLAARGRPDCLADLADHDALPLSDTPWRFHIAGQEGESGRHPPSRITTGSMETLHALCLGGLGIACFSDWYVAPDLASGRLVPLPLRDATIAPLPLWAITPTARLVPPKVRLFLEALRRQLALEPTITPD